MPRKNELPKKARYNFVSRRAYALLDAAGIESLPVNLKTIIRFFDNILVVSYSQIRTLIDSNKTGSDAKADAEMDRCAFILNPAQRSNHLEAATYKFRGGRFYLIIFDDSLKNTPRLRWSIAHELGHIFLGHFVNFEATSLHEDGLSDEKYGVLEKEAHWFAAQLLSPKPALYIFKYKDRPEYLSQLCNISYYAAAKRAAELSAADYDSSGNYLLLQRNFSNDVLSANFNFAMQDGLYWLDNAKPDNDLTKLNIDGDNLIYGFDEFIYWPYVKYMMKRDNAELAELCSILAYSTVYTNGSTFIVIYGKYDDGAVVIKNNLNVIKAYIKLFGLVKMKKVFSLNYEKETHSLYKYVSIISNDENN
jgi:hypothetical protein